MYYFRHIENDIQSTFERGKSILLLGARQTGKTTLIQHIPCDLYITLLNPELRLRYEERPQLLAQEIQHLSSKHNRPAKIMIDEIQKVPALLDVIQWLIDDKKAVFILTGSSARKLRHGSQINLLPGRIRLFRLDPFSFTEWPQAPDLIDLLTFGSLPGIAPQDAQEKNKDLRSYVTAYLEEEIKAEAVVRRLGTFSRFLELAASESGKIANFSKLSQDIGVSRTTIASYYSILEDCLIAERFEPYTLSTFRKKLTKSPRYVVFDLGVRRLCAKEGTTPSLETLGHWFEQFIGLELLRISRSQMNDAFQIKFWRDPEGPEVDWVLTNEHKLVPIEVKLSSKPTDADAKHLKKFLKEYPQATKGYIVCQTPQAFQINSQIEAISYKDLNAVLPTTP